MEEEKSSNVNSERINLDDSNHEQVEALRFNLLNMPPDTNMISRNDDKILTKKKKSKFSRKSRNLGYAASQLNSLLSQSSHKQLGTRNSNPLNLRDTFSSDEVSPFPVGLHAKNSAYDSGQGEVNFNQYVPTTLRQEILPEFVVENKDTPNVESDDSDKTRS